MAELSLSGDFRTESNKKKVNVSVTRRWRIGPPPAGLHQVSVLNIQPVLLHPERGQHPEEEERRQLEACDGRGEEKRRTPAPPPPR